MSDAKPIPPNPGKKVKCGKCKVENDQGSRFCHACGAAMSKVCPGCHTSIDPQARFCPKCGGSTP